MLIWINQRQNNNLKRTKVDVQMYLVLFTNPVSKDIADTMLNDCIFTYVLQKNIFTFTFSQLTILFSREIVLKSVSIINKMHVKLQM